jgi:hypothetical protein
MSGLAAEDRRGVEPAWPLIPPSRYRPITVNFKPSVLGEFDAVADKVEGHRKIVVFDRDDGPTPIGCNVRVGRAPAIDMPQRRPAANISALSS